MGTGVYGGFGNTTGNQNNEQTENTAEKINSIVSNAEAMKQTYPINKNGYFGEKGKNCRVIKSANPVATSKDFYTRISKGGQEAPLSNNHGVMTVLPDKTRIVYRVITSTKGSPAVEIIVTSPKTVKTQKIHFIGRDN